MSEINPSLPFVKCKAVETWYVYALVDPRHPEDPRYVGWTVSPDKRLWDHISTCRKLTNHKARWLAKLRRAGIRPGMQILETGHGDGWAETEAKWIRKLRSRGHRLTNSTNGGEGVPGHRHSQESKDKMAKAKSGKKLSAEHRAKIAESNKGKHVLTTEQKAAMAAGRKRTPMTKERRDWYARTAKRNFNSPESIAKRNATNTGHKTSEETKAKLRANRIGKKLTPEHCLKLSLAKRRVRTLHGQMLLFV